MSLFKLISKLFGSLFGEKEDTTLTTTTTERVNGTIQKKALCIGINDYKGTNNDLNGCVNDAKGWKKMLKENYGFDSIKMLLDSDATKANVLREMSKLIKEAQNGDTVVITYSGHGSSVADKNGDEADGKDETLFLYNGHLIDDKIRETIAKKVSGVKLVMIFDSCHSGTATRSFISTMSDDSFYTKPRYMPPHDDIEAVVLNAIPIRKKIFYEDDMNHILITGCLSTEYSYDARFNGKSMGAFSHYALLILKDNPNITYNDFYKKLKIMLPSDKYPQTPQLEGPKKDKNKVMFK